MVRSIAIYDLDGTLLRRATFTPFLIFAARERARWRLILLPAWFAAMGLYKAGLFSRQTLKQFGLRLFLGHRVAETDLSALSRRFVARILPGWIAPGAARAMERDRAEGRVMVVASAAMEFYAAIIGDEMGFEHVLATRSAISGSVRIDGLNCYGDEKLRRMEEIFEVFGFDRNRCHVRAYSDSLADLPLLDWADDGVLVNPGRQAVRQASERGWQVADFRR